MSLSAWLRPAKAGPRDDEAAPLGDGGPAQPVPAQLGAALPSAAQPGPAQPVPAQPGAALPGPAHIESLWQPKGQAKARAKGGRARAGRARAKTAPPMSGTGIALDGGTAARARVSSGQVVSYEVFRAGAGGDALSEAL